MDGVFASVNPEIMENVLQALAIMGKGMLGIFMVMILIALLVVIMNHLGNKNR